MTTDYYEQAQSAIAMLKTAIRGVLLDPSTPPEGLRNTEIAKLLGIRGGIESNGKIVHKDWIPRTLLEEMRDDGTVECDRKLWKLVS